MSTVSTMLACPLDVHSYPILAIPAAPHMRQPRYADIPSLKRSGVAPGRAVVRPLISGQAVPRNPAATPPRSSLRQGADSHTGPGARRPIAGPQER